MSSFRTFAARAFTAACVLGAASPTHVAAQNPATWGDSLIFHTFSIAATDPRTGEVGVAVTTRVACVGNGVPWVRAGVGAVATQANTRTEYGAELLDAIGGGATPSEALTRLLALDSAAASRQIGVIGKDGRSAQHTGTRTSPWAGHRAGTHYVTQGNLLVGPEVVDAVAAAFEASEGSARHLADRLIEAIAAGHAKGGDGRKGRQQSAAVIVADARPGRARRSDGVTANISVCEHPEPVAELRRVYEAISQTLGYRTLQQFGGNDVWQLKIMLNALGYFRPRERPLQRGDDAMLFTSETVTSVESFRAAERLAGVAAGSPAGLVDDETVARLWAALERAGKARAVRELLLESTAVRR
ncbi:MAG: DUF1028 domain-containing protein [Gemmatimonadaceae bacterium]